VKKFRWISVKIRISAFGYYYVWLPIKKSFFISTAVFWPVFATLVFEVSIIGVFTNDTKSAWSN